MNILTLTMDQILIGYSCSTIVHLFHIFMSSPYYALGNVLVTGESTVRKGDITCKCLADSRNLDVS